MLRGGVSVAREQASRLHVAGEEAERAALLDERHERARVQQHAQVVQELAYARDEQRTADAHLVVVVVLVVALVVVVVGVAVVVVESTLLHDGAERVAGVRVECGERDRYAFVEVELDEYELQAFA